MARHKVVRSPRLIRRRRRALRRRRIALAILCAAFIGGALYLMTRPEFLITEVAVSGESPIPREEAAALVRQELAGAYLFAFPKASVFFYPRRSIEGKLLERFPELASVAISLQNLGAVSVALFPRRAVAKWCAGAGAGAGAEAGAPRCVLIDATGFAFKDADDKAPARFPRVHDRTGTAPSADVKGRAVLSGERLAAFLSLLAGLQKLGFATARLDLLSGGELAAYPESGGKILLREDGDFADELARLDALLSEQGLLPRGRDAGLRVEYLDLRYGNKIYFKPKGNNQ